MTDIDFKTITGDDHGVIVRGLIWAIAAIEELPAHERSVDTGNEEDRMRAIVNEMAPGQDIDKQILLRRLKMRPAR